MRIQRAVDALAAGDPLAALSQVALHDDPPSLALRGIALSQIGELPRAYKLLARAVRAFGPAQPLARARCVTALAEIALATRELNVPLGALTAALGTFTQRGEAHNALHARLVLSRSLIMLGQLERAAEALGGVRLRHAPAALVASTELIRAELALRRLDARSAQTALERGRRAAELSGIEALQCELARVQAALDVPAARLIREGETHRLSMLELMRALAQESWLLNAFRRSLRFRARIVSMARRPVLFALLRALAEAWPHALDRTQLIRRGFDVKHDNASHRARLRVELGRLRRLLAGVARVQAEEPGYRLQVPAGARVCVLAPPHDGEEAELLALLGDGEAWSSSVLASALGMSQRSLQRLLLALQAQGAVRSIGRGRAQRWLAPPIAGLGLSLLGLFQSELAEG